MVRIINIYITVTKQLASHLYLIIGNSRLYLYAKQQTAIFSKFLELTLFLVIWGHVGVGDFSDYLLIVTSKHISPNKSPQTISPRSNQLPPL